MSVSDDNIYRVTVNPNTKVVDIICFGLEGIDTSVCRRYMGINETPQWIREKLAVLTMMDDTPPTEEVDGVGRRIDTNTFWVFRNE